VQITLLNPPQGEGKRYWAHPKDLRPALEWTMESDWIAVKPLLAEDVINPDALHSWSMILCTFIF